jgi:methyltransferase (TIGR00027 family)
MLPPHVVFIELDFDREDLGSRMIQSTFQTEQPTFFVWEGVTNYLTGTAVDSTLRWIGSSAAGNELVFTYVHRDIIENYKCLATTERLRRTLARVGEPWRFGLHPAEVRDFLAARGLELVKDVNAREYRARYLGETGAGYEFYHVVCARVVGI